MRNVVRRYLHLLGFDRAPRELEGLRQLVRAHILRVPFENISKLLLFEREHKGRQTILEEFLDGIEFHDLGGTCYTSNPFFADLLRELGYDAVLLGCDMNSPNVHTSIRVRIEGIAYHVDVGNAAPFLEPICLDRLPHEIRRGELRWFFERANDGRLECRVYSGNEHVHGYRVNEVPHELGFFRSIVEDSFQKGRTFMGLLRLVRIFPEHTVELKNCSLRVHRGSETTERILTSMSELRAAVDREFMMPRCPVGQAVEILERLNGFDFFTQAAERSLYA
jgi:arylamine N-acetyltransferase